VEAHRIGHNKKFLATCISMRNAYLLVDDFSSYRAGIAPVPSSSKRSNLELRRRALERSDSLINTVGLRLKSTFRRSASVEADQVKIEQAIFNLLDTL